MSTKELLDEAMGNWCGIGVDTLSFGKLNLRISDPHFEKLVTIKRHVVMQHAVNCVQ